MSDSDWNISKYPDNEGAYYLVVNFLTNSYGQTGMDYASDTGDFYPRVFSTYDKAVQWLREWNPSIEHRDTPDECEEVWYVKGDRYAQHIICIPEPDNMGG